MEDFDLVVVGGGAGGLAAAKAGIRAGKKTLLISDSPLGGDCTFYGCVPSKTLIEAANQGLGFVEAFKRVRETVAAIAITESKEVISRLGIKVVEGRAAFTSSDVLTVDQESFRGSRIVIATGSSPVIPPIRGLAAIGYLSNETLFDLTDPPRSIAIVGGGPIGCEIAQALARLGVKTYLLESRERLLTGEEPEASLVTEAVLSRMGIEVILSSVVEGMSKIGNGEVYLEISGGRTVTVEKVLIAVGRRARIEGLGLDRAGVEVNGEGFIVADKYLNTSSPTIFACGDVTGKLMFTHAADQMGRLAVRNAFASRVRRVRYETSSTPSVIYVNPEVASVGMTEDEASKIGGRVAYLPLSAVDRAAITGEVDGFIKLIAGPRGILRNVGGGKLLGATIVAPRAGEMIHEVALAMRTRMFTGRLAQTVHAYPAWSVGIQLAAAQFFFEIDERTARPARANRQ